MAVPKFNPVTKPKVFYGFETEYDHRQVDGGNLAGKAVERRVGDLENLSSKSLVGRDQLGDVAGRGLGVIDQTDELSDHRGQGRQPDDALGDSLEAFLLLVVHDSPARFVFRAPVNWHWQRL